MQPCSPGGGNFRVCLLPNPLWCSRKAGAQEFRGVFGWFPWKEGSEAWLKAPAKKNPKSDEGKMSISPCLIFSLVFSAGKGLSFRVSWNFYDRILNSFSFKWKTLHFLDGMINKRLCWLTATPVKTTWVFVKSLFSPLLHYPIHIQLQREWEGRN